MKALVKYGKGEYDIELREVPEPIPQKDEVKIEVKATGICGTDLHGYSALKPPIVLGHETAGVVVEIGKEVQGIKIGDRVITETTAYICGKCRYCQVKEYNLCSHRKGLGSAVNGAFAKYFVIRGESIHRIPSHIDFISATLFEPLSCAVHVVIEQANLQKEETALILGPGPFGLLIAQVAKALETKVMIGGIKGDENRLSLARELGIDLIFNFEKKDFKEYLSNLNLENSIDVVFECSGTTSAAQYGLEIVRKGGRYIQAGIILEPITLNFNELLFNRELTFIGSRTQRPSSWGKAIQLVNEGKVNLSKLVSEVLPLNAWREGFRKAHSKDSVKVILLPE